MVAIIPEGTTRIRAYAFAGCNLLESVTIPESVKKIGDDAFSGCTSLKSITIPESVTKIDEFAFDDHSALTAIYVPAKKVDYYKELLPEELHDKIVELESEKRTKVRK